ncbi:hypothetical protein C8Q77DRAFT_1153076 [Trametes polyzona]|nr:hypothetical protein C8Q77DRAFT_1153076 [Trametes polyzona]
MATAEDARRWRGLPEHLQGTAPIDPNLSQSIIRSTTVAPMVFSSNASNNDKDHSRATLKSRVQSRLQTALMPRRHIQSSTVIVPSVPQSECSTLVDFAIDDTLIKQEVEEIEDDAEDYMLDADNSAWSTGKYTPSKASKRYAGVRVHVREVPSQDQLLSADNSAWVAARPSAAQTNSRAWFATAGRRPQATPVVQAQMLDPEDRAWM